MPNIRVLIVDDSLVMRRALRQIIEQDPAVEIVGEASDGRRAVAMNASLRPDVITMDVNMPVMDGIEALTVIMRDAPTRVLMVSALTTAGAQATLSALEAGAIDILAKPSSEIITVGLEPMRAPLLEKIHAVATANLDALRRAPRRPPERPESKLAGPGERVVVIGTSTGGPQALQSILPALPGNLPTPVLIVQHMPPTFTAQMAKRLNSLCELNVSEAREGDELRAGRVLIAPGDQHLVLRDRLHAGLELEPSEVHHRPSVDELFLSAEAVYGSQAVAVILTGMGDDGCVGAQRLKARGATVIAQDRDTSAIYGMPGSVVDSGAADVICPLSLIPGAIVKALRK